MTLAIAPARIAVIGLGNVLLGDDAFGPFVIELLRARWEFPACVALLDAGTPGLDLVAYLHARELVILVDAVGAGGRPGEMRRFRGEDLRRLPPTPRVSPHDPAVQEALWMADLAGCAPHEVLLFGVIPGSLQLGAALSGPVCQAAWATATRIVQELTSRGVAPQARCEQRALDTWWMRERVRQPA